MNPWPFVVAAYAVAVGLTGALLLSNTGVIPMEAPAYGFVGQYLLPLGIPLLLFKANVRTVLTEGAPEAIAADPQVRAVYLGDSQIAGAGHG